MALRYFTALVGGALSVLGLTVLPAAAEAKPYPVRIESQPSGATVYLDSKEGDPLGQTPFSGRIPAGSHTLIVELEGYVSQVQDIKVRRKRRVQRIAVKLSKIELATIQVSAERSQQDLRGASILVDGREVGNLPDTIRVPAGAHQIEVVKEGYRTFETWVEATGGEELTVKAELKPIGGRKPKVAAAGKGARDQVQEALDREEQRLASADAEDPIGDEPREPEGTAQGSTEDAVDDEPAADPSGRQVPFVAVGAGFELGGRRFRPNSADVVGLREYDAGGVPMLRFSGEVNPLAFSPSIWLSGWGLFVSYARATPLDSTARLMNGNEVSVPTVWSELDVGARYRYRFRPESFVGAEFGYGKHSFTFDFSDETDELAAEVPDVEYSFWRIGLEGRYGFDRFAALASGGTRLVSSIGKLADRFARTDIVAVHATIGMAATLTDSIEARLVGRYDHYSHEYTGMATGAGSNATSGTDQFFGATLSALFHY
jgi:PEGA domain